MPRHRGFDQEPEGIPLGTLWGATLQESPSFDDVLLLGESKPDNVLALLLEDIRLGEATPDTVLDEAGTGVSTGGDVFDPDEIGV